MANRKSIPKSIRFEVFKRDKFTCQYCGKSAPDVILHVDHINPLANNGTNDVVNLITACSECNLGKGARELTDDMVIKKRKVQLDDLQERREQLEMMAEWQRGLIELESIEVDRVAEILDSMKPGWEYSDIGKIELRKLVKKYSAAEVIEAGKTVRDQYVVIGVDGYATQESANAFANLLPTVCKNQAMFNHNPHLGQFMYIGGIIRNRFGVKLNNDDIQMLCKATDKGANVDDLIEHAKYIKNYFTWRKDIRTLILESNNG